MPEMTFEWALRANNIDPKKDLNIDTSIAFAAMSGTFIGGVGDFVTLFEPLALQVEAQGFGYVVASIGQLSGEVPYTVYNARKSYIEDNREIIEKFTRAIQKGLDYVHNNKEEDVAQNILSYFPDNSLNDVIKIVNRYKDNDSWYKDTLITEDNFNHVQNIIEAADELEKRAPYEKLVNTTFSNPDNN